MAELAGTVVRNCWEAPARKKKVRRLADWSEMHARSRRVVTICDHRAKQKGQKGQRAPAAGPG